MNMEKGATFGGAWKIFLGLSAAITLGAWWAGLFYLPPDKDQGDVFRIIFVHVPSAWNAFFWVIFAAVCSVVVLVRRQKEWNQAQAADQWAQSAMELGTLFSVLTLLTGSIWGRPTWGVWWDWDPRLTSTLVMFLVCCGYHLLRSFTPDPRSRRQVSAVIALLSAINVPIVYYSVNLWRSLHQPQSFAKKSSNVSSDISQVLLFSFLGLFLTCVGLFWLRRQSLANQETLETLLEGKAHE